MVILGILSIIQMIFLPGLIISTLLHIKSNGITRLIIIFGISLCVNYLLVVFLTLTHLFLQVTVLVIIILEIITCFWLFRKKLLVSFEDLSHRFEQRVKFINYSLSDNPNSSSFLNIVKHFVFLVFLIFAFTDIVWVVQRLINNLGTVFQTWDAVVSWNRWAVEWSQGIFPTATSYYPQLIPANWSISYVLTNGIELQSFPKAIMPLFSLFILLMLFDLGIKTKSFGFFIGVILTRLLIKKFTGEYISDGYVDLPMSFFSFASIYFLLLARLKADRKEFDIGLIWTSVIFAAGAALTKQAGVFILVLLPFLWYLLVFRQKAVKYNKQTIITLIVIYILALLIVFAGYLIKWIHIHTGFDSSNIAYVTKDIYQGAGYIERALDAFVLLGKYKYLFLGLIPAVFVVKKPYRWLGVVVAIPFSLIWVFFFSYEVRNLALVFPIWGLTIGLFIQQLYDYLINLLNIVKIQKIPAISVLLVFIIALGFIGFKIPPAQLIKNQNERQWQIFNPELNGKIRELVVLTGTDIKILTNYPVDYLPGLNGSQISFWYDNLPDYISSIDNPEIDYLLVPNNAISGIRTEILEGLKNGTLKLIFSSEGAYSFQMLQVLH
ncbi:MAG: hypothetical protein CVU43_17155 [Chloroflexi bacterium HGW-Chloroflexi-5]|jgi:hypothetical protein|nr:MAG: hypothetical protein CVU43_17155 [Chloroflexi bacterium HGW-Chloroflexi-5]